MVTGAPTSSASGPNETLRLLADVAVDLFGRCERPDLSQRIRIAQGRVERSTAVVCVVGEFKQGKSSLVNELIGRTVCPVDDDLATSVISIVHYAPDVQVTVHRREADREVTQPISPGEIASWVTEGGNPDNRLAVDRVEIALPSAFLERGPALVDTPGAGGLAAGHAAATIGFLPFADAVLFVSDASSELSDPELDFLVRARQVCPVVLFCLSKTDLYPQWRRIAEIDDGHLQRSGIDIPILPVSSALRGIALERNDRGLNEESGFPDLLLALDRQVLSRTRALAQDRLRSEIAVVATELAGTMRAELAVLGDPGCLTATVEQLDSARLRLETLKEGSARWGVVLGDRITDLGNDVNHRFRSGIRDLLREADEGFERANNNEAWTALSATLVDQLASLTAEVFTTIRDEAQTTKLAVADLLSDEEGGVALSFSGVGPVDIKAFWAAGEGAGPSSEKSGGVAAVGTGVDQGLNLLRGAYGAVSVFGILARVLPVAAGSVLLSNPFTLGAGVIFGVRQIRAQGTRRVAAQRQQARSTFRAAVEHSQQQITKEIGDAIRSVQRELRDGFAARINELQRTTTELIARCREDAARDETSREQRRAAFAALLPRLDELATAALTPPRIESTQ